MNSDKDKRAHAGSFILNNNEANTSDTIVISLIKIFSEGPDVSLKGRLPVAHNGCFVGC